LDANSERESREVEVRALQSPNCLDATVTGNGSEILVRVEKELAVEVLGRTKLCVMTCDLAEKKDTDFVEDDDELLDEVEIED